ncbi:ArdC family protein [Tuberibacillus sp. Marseille-P3662]|uniref:ArdC family protein n=1 Tax=Tuberibacillus sp. Marseille-P3662 TaxID=1965358 RepID=UPI000A1CA2DB|nr:ArdC-like ssDNA-binding domain-containing protein [Tuberibacillus sp. Marseille-P3662]
MAYKKSKNYQADMDKIQKEVDQSIERIFKNDEFQRYLEVVSKFPKYSLNNVMMITAQKPDATMVQGYNAWKKLDRQVQKGEKALKILAPVTKKVDMTRIDPKTQKPVLDKNGNEVTEKKDMLTGFRMVSTFDVSQTKGKELFKLRDFIQDDLKESDRINQLYQDFKGYLNQHTTFDVKEQALDDDKVNGYFRPADDTIRVNAKQENTSMKFKTLIHEYAHAQLHHQESDMKDLPRGHKEAQAESVAFVVSKYYGLDTSQYSAGYIAGWAKNIKLAKQAMQEIQNVSNHTIREIDDLMKDRVKEIQHENGKDKEESKDLSKSNSSKKEAELEL